MSQSRRKRNQQFTFITESREEQFDTFDQCKYRLRLLRALPRSEKNGVRHIHKFTLSGILPTGKHGTMKWCIGYDLITAVIPLRKENNGNHQEAGGQEVSQDGQQEQAEGNVPEEKNLIIASITGDSAEESPANVALLADEAAAA